jgi:hypothetical protein
MRQQISLRSFQWFSSCYMCKKTDVTKTMGTSPKLVNGKHVKNELNNVRDCLQNTVQRGFLGVQLLQSFTVPKP